MQTLVALIVPFKAAHKVVAASYPAAGPVGQKGEISVGFSQLDGSKHFVAQPCHVFVVLVSKSCAISSYISRPVLR